MQLKTSQKERLLKIKRAYKLFRTSWKVQGKLFFERSTLHGVRYIAEKGRPFIERLMWFVCVSAGAIAAMMIIVSLWEKFQTNPTITGLDTDFHTWDVAFPAVTVCQDQPVDIKVIDAYIEENNIPSEKMELFREFVLNISQISYNTLPLLSQHLQDQNFLSDDTDLKDFIFPFFSRCEHIYSDCVWKSEKYNCCEGFFPVFTETGFCYTFNSRHYEKKLPWRDELLAQFELKYIKETDIKWSLKFDIANNLNESTTSSNVVPIYIHNSDDVSGLDIKPQHIWENKVDRISFSVKQTYTTNDTRQLSMKQRHCIFEDEVRLSIDHKYTYTACTRECRMNTAKKLCNCVPHFYPKTNNFRHCNLKELKCISDHLEEIQNVDRCSCMLGCSNTVYEVQKFNDNPEAQGIEAEFVSWPMVRYKREVLFGWVDLLVSFGGIAGLFLGFSLLSGVEVLYYFTIRACCMVKMEKNDLLKMQRDKIIKKKRSDLNIVQRLVGKRNKNELFKRNINIITQNKISPLATKSDGLVVSPFGIEFLH